MPPDSPISAIAHTIQLSVSPVFLLLALGAFLNVLSLRLGRITDRARFLESRPQEAGGELVTLRRRRRLVNWAVSFATFGALIVCVLIASAFIASIVHTDASKLVAGLFITAMAAFIGMLLTLLAEIRLAIRSLSSSQ